MLTRENIENLLTRGGNVIGTDGEKIGTIGWNLTRKTAGPTTDDAMTRSEERLNVATERQTAGRVRKPFPWSGSTWTRTRSPMTSRWMNAAGD